MHETLNFPLLDFDVIVHSGDFTNSRNPKKNEAELDRFLVWYNKIECEYKVLVAGNHDVALAAKPKLRKKIEDLGIIYLENEAVEINGLKFYGSPHTPSFGDWVFQKNRGTINREWAKIPGDTDILITHGPRKYVSDLTLNRENKLQAVGDSALGKAIDRLDIRAHLFGHVHNFKGIRNAGITEIDGVKYSNGASAVDGKKDKLYNHGNLFFVADNFPIF